ncbi:MAG: hypothetical protein UY45_C0003G0106 [Parcubacteria group bacterium GW2011_GWA1_49_26]|uniref:Uncharacterized protein n=1 Tax=Candidatus Yanofskybacteria bacterium GW2011_GWC1_48_11 TaxID=1619027 RepID=A0A837ILX6_9BACT|nr:MAG: hypothetical protein UY25_C0001G0027 [Candidatus Yanofskybacteria bacterium GW2011_GWC1_48_11]KKW04000.1 MAG: hypothetical protein UY38_C0002G0154 [Parcubacteria group bacterium GW2011_GWB1_49_12]KKW08899.1 MAG: hypothetical protein UY45_C0003G0106 [Parcubacteria group bacterium GW2011_GWA1_49_26]
MGSPSIQRVPVLGMREDEGLRRAFSRAQNKPVGLRRNRGERELLELGAPKKVLDDFGLCARSKENLLLCSSGGHWDLLIKVLRLAQTRRPSWKSLQLGRNPSTHELLSSYNPLNSTQGYKKASPFREGAGGSFTKIGKCSLT